MPDTGMGWQRIAGTAVEAALILGILAILAGTALGQPVLLGYVETGSMQPTLDPGDGFVAVPAAVAGPVEEGDVVVYRAEQVNGGQLTTHRVVGETERGYVTRGDANPFTDQADGEPPVKETQVVATALQVNGRVVEIPHLGTAVMGVQSQVASVQRRLAALLGTRSLLGVQGIGYLLFAVTAILYIADLVRDRGRKGRERSRSRSTGIDPRLWSAGFALLVVAAATAAMVGPAGAQEYGVVSAEFDSERPTVIPAGETETVTHPVGNAGVLPVVSYMEADGDGVSVDPERVRVPARESRNATVALTAPPETGYYRQFVVEHRYLAVLPTPVIDTLYRVHPWAPLVAIDALFGVGFYMLGVAAAGSGRIRRRERSENVSIATRIRRLVRRTYR
ncbi:MAG: signal peptidase I [Halobacteriales archaeon]